MKILVFSLLLFSLQVSLACSLNRPLVSLSGSLTYALAGVNLLSDSNLKAISIFHPFNEFKKLRRLPGGIFLSSKTLDEFKNAIFIYDESIELKKTLEKSGIKAEPIVTRGLVPLEVVDLTLKKIKPFLNQCDLEVKKYREKIQSKIMAIKEKFPKKTRAVFFMGEIKNGRFPDLIISNDGIIKWLRNEKLIETYPSDLAYIQWSVKILSSLYLDYKIGLKDTGSNMVKKIHPLSGTEFNLFYPGALIPGEGQLDAILYLATYLAVAD